MVNDERYEQLRGEIRDRLASICAGMPPELFDDMVDEIAANARKSELRTTVMPSRRAGKRID